MVKRGNTLKDYEVSLIKAMLENGQYKANQHILAYFTRPSRSVNHARISEIADAMRGEPMHKNARKYVDQPIASKSFLQEFLNTWPNIDPETGLHIQDDELILKSREAMLFAVQAYNNPTTYFKSEMFIVSTVIGWLYLLHHYYKKMPLISLIVEKTEHLFRLRGGINSLSYHPVWTLRPAPWKKEQ